MLRAMRRMRGKLLAAGETGKYFRYAVGEIVLVVIGIVIALQLNTANQERVEQRRVRQYAHALLADLEEDKAMLEPIFREMSDVRARVVQLGDYVASRPILEVRNIDLYFLVRAPFYRPFTWNTATLEQMKSAGVLRQMRNRELAGKISAYEGFQNHLAEDYLHDRKMAVQALALAGKIVNMNYPSMEAFVTPEELKLGKKYIQFGSSVEDSEVHRAFGQLNRPLLVKDEVLLGEMVNAYRQLSNSHGLWPRLLVEMPDLQRDIDDLIAALQVEYGE